MRRKAKPAPAWQVVVRGVQYNPWFADSSFDGVAVELVKGYQKVVFGKLRIDDPSFEDKVTTMKAEALERAAALTAVEAI